MSDASVITALRTEASMVVIEAPAGCGKTHQAAAYCKDCAPSLSSGRMLILTHTHAATDEVARRTSAIDNIEIRTIDSFIGEIAAVYHKAIKLPADIHEWARTNKDGYDEIAGKVASLLSHAAHITKAIVARYPIIVCDEHQDSSENQHQIVDVLFRAGAKLRIFADPMQAIYERKARQQAADRWSSILRTADCTDKLETPHRWTNRAPDLGDWIQRSRSVLEHGGAIDLRGKLPTGLRVIHADNQALRHGQIAFTKEARKEIDAIVSVSQPLLLLSAHNNMVRSIRAFYNRRIPVWEGHTRYALDALVSSLTLHKGDAIKIADTIIKFLSETAIGFSPSGYGKVLTDEIRNGCKNSRKGKPLIIQNMSRQLLDFPNHYGVSKVLKTIKEVIQSDDRFNDIKIDHAREFSEAIVLGDFDDPIAGLSELTRRRTFVRRPPPLRAISTIHKAKGLEVERVMILPCDMQSFKDTEYNRCKLYVAISRPYKELTLVVSSNVPKSLLVI